jgi:hypothetical protein
MGRHVWLCVPPHNGAVKCSHCVPLSRVERVGGWVTYAAVNTGVWHRRQNRRQRRCPLIVISARLKFVSWGRYALALYKVILTWSFTYNLWETYRNITFLKRTSVWDLTPYSLVKITVLYFRSLYLVTHSFMELSTSWEAASCALSENFPALYGTLKFITVFTRALHWSLSWARSIQSIPYHPISLRSILIMSTHSLQSITVSTSRFLATDLNRGTVTVSLNYT